MLLQILNKILSVDKLYLDFNVSASTSDYKLSDTLYLTYNCNKNIERIFSSVYSKNNQEANHLMSLYNQLVDIEAYAFEGYLNDKDRNPTTRERFESCVSRYKKILIEIDRFRDLNKSLVSENKLLRSFFDASNLDTIMRYVSTFPKYSNLSADLYPIRTVQHIIEKRMSVGIAPEIIIDISDRFGIIAQENYAIGLMLDSESDKYIYDTISKDAMKVSKVKEFFKNYPSAFFNISNELICLVDITPEVLDKIVKYTFNESVNIVKESANSLKKMGNAVDGKYTCITDIVQDYYNQVFGKTIENSQKLEKESQEQLGEKLVDVSEFVEDKFKNIVGLEEVKEEIKDMLKLCQKLKLVNSFDMAQSHMCFLGNPGTGKTTVARIVGRALHKGGFLKSGNFVEIGAASLKGEFVGQTAPKVQELFKKANGGVLFIDEAYQLAENSRESDSYGKDALATLMKEMEENKDVLVIFAGYTEQTQKFIDVNPGLRSRINTYIEFKDYSTDELLKIANIIAADRKFTFVDSAIEELRTYFDESKNQTNFANGRFVRSTVTAVELAQSRRAELGDFNITGDDVKKAIEKLRKNKNEPRKREPIGFKLPASSN